MLTQQVDTLKKKMEVINFVSTNENREVSKKYTKLWDETKYLIKTINGGKSGEYGKDFMKINFTADDDLPLNKPIKFHAMAIIIRPAFEKNLKYYPEIHLDECLCEL